MNYQSRIREIQSAFVMEYQDRETCISMFEELLHDYGLLPKDDQLDRTITNENFLNLLKAAREHRDLPPQSPSTAIELARPPYRIADSIKQNCPVCQKPVPALFNRVQSMDQQFIPVDPPRCQSCMMKWVEERFGVSASGSKPSNFVSLHLDKSPASPLRPDETTFFAEYEKQMTEPS